MSRKLYAITIRRTFTGCDYSKDLWLADPAEALTAASKNVPRAERNGLRLLRCVALNGWRLYLPNGGYAPYETYEDARDAARTFGMTATLRKLRLGDGWTDYASYSPMTQRFHPL